MALQVDERIGEGGRFAVVRRLGAGLSLETVLLRDVRSGDLFSARFLKAHLRHNEKLKMQFRELVLAQANWQREGIWRAVEFIDTNDHFAILSEHSDVPSFRQHCEGAGHLGPQELRPLAEALCADLSFLHREAGPHLTLSPDSIFVCEESGVAVPRIVGAGIAEILSSEGNAPLVTDGLTTSSFIAPEVLRGNRRSDVRSDIFAVGALLLYAASGEAPFGRGSAYEITHRVLSGAEPRAFAARNPGYRVQLDEVLARALRFEPRERYATAEEFQAALVGALTERERPPVVQSLEREVTDLSPAPEKPKEVESSPVGTQGNASSQDRWEMSSEVSEEPDVTGGRSSEGRSPARAALAFLVLALIGGAAAFVLWSGQDQDAPRGLLSEREAAEEPASSSARTSTETSRQVVRERRTEPEETRRPARTSAGTRSETQRPTTGTRRTEPEETRRPARTSAGTRSETQRSNAGSGRRSSSSESQRFPFRYQARLSAVDHRNSHGRRLVRPYDVVAQDRANVHRFSRADREDTLDTFFDSANERAVLREMARAALERAPAVARAIEQGTPLVEVVVHQGHVEVRLLED